MKIYIALLLTLFLLNTSCRKKCSEEASKKSYLDPQLNAYFGMFKKGNYWVYENQDKSKRDSIYVTSYDRKFVLDITACDDVETLEFTLKENSKEIVASDFVCVKGFTNNINTQNCQASVFFTSILSTINFYPDTILASNYEVQKLNSITINGKTYSGQIIQLRRDDTLFMQSGIGIIGWKENNSTYNLVNKYLQP